MYSYLSVDDTLLAGVIILASLIVEVFVVDDLKRTRRRQKARK